MLSGAELSIAEWVLLGIIVIGLPIEAEIVTRIFKPRIVRGEPNARRSLYVYSIVTLWALAVAILAVWAVSGRDWAALGFRFEANLPTLIACGVAALIAGFFVFQLLQMSFSAAAREAYGEALAGAGGAHYFMPQTRAEYGTFKVLGTTAGITEEIIFRGFLIWALSLFMPLWLAAVGSLALFVLMHRYQGTTGLVQVTVAGAVITAIYVASGSLYPVIALHIAVDVLNAAVFWRASGNRAEA